jgi:Recombination endonuclease VII
MMCRDCGEREASNSDRRCNPCHYVHRKPYHQGYLRTAAGREAHKNADAKRQSSKFDLTPAEHEQLMAEGCQACGSIIRVVRDHDHTTGEFRGALCNNCNLALGLLDDSVERLEQLIAYLRTANGLVLL